MEKDKEKNEIKNSKQKSKIKKVKEFKKIDTESEKIMKKKHLNHLFQDEI
jgi:hypothetical protein